MDSIINLTPHTVTVIGSEGGKVALPQGGRPARCKLRDDHTDDFAFGDITVPIVENRFGGVYGLPDPVTGVRIVVSRTVAMALAGTRTDLLVPNGFVFDDARRVAGCTSFMKFTSCSCSH